MKKQPKYSPEVIERAVRNELARGGQVYFVHNRVESIFSIAHLLQRLVPEARIAIGHGRRIANDGLDGDVALVDDEVLYECDRR